MVRERPSARTLYHHYTMHHLFSIALLAATATAGPNFSPRDSNETSSNNIYYSAQTLEACNATPNCETYETSRGLKIRSISGREPGSDWYKNNLALTKRDDNPVTHVTYGRKSLNYGSVGQAGPMERFTISTMSAVKGLVTPQPCRFPLPLRLMSTPQTTHWSCILKDTTTARTNAIYSLTL